MKERHWLIAAAAAVGLLGAAGSASAEEAKPAPEAAPVQVAQASSGAATEAAAAEEPPAFTWGASADAYFTTNFNNPNPAFNMLRAFDVYDEHGPHFGLLDLWGQYARKPIGFRVDLAFGVTARLVNAFEPSASDFWGHVQQLYVSANLNKKGTTYVDFGKWVTMAGAEVIEPKDNWLYTRGLLFTLAIPFYHMGLRGYHYFNDTDYAFGAVHRGWNAVGGPGHALGYAVGYNKALSKKWNLLTQYYFGEETATATVGEKWRNLIDIVATYNASDRWAFTLNPDFVQQGSSTLGGLSAQAKYTLSPRQYLAARGEFLLDDGFLGTDAYSFSLGFTHMVNKHFQTKAEYRHDSASSDVFFGSSLGSVKGSQDTFLISAILSY
jgi:hypothetical protein